MGRKETVGVLKEIFETGKNANGIFEKYSHKTDANHTEEDFEAMGKLLEKVKHLNITLEHSVSNEYLNSLFAALSHYVSGCNIIGAGSGGFILGFLRDGVNRDEVKRNFAETHPDVVVTDVRLVTWDDMLEHEDN
jgi:galactokinase/mevalonate kinase-like predicted kinase